jgi:hypothetical protein
MEHTSYESTRTRTARRQRDTSLLNEILQPVQVRALPLVVLARELKRELFAAESSERRRLSENCYLKL